jgi:uncharacterized protein YcbX
MPAKVVGLFRYPVKGLSAEPQASVDLHAGRGFPGDRAFALASPTNAFDEAAPVALRKTEFLMLARQEALARLQTAFDPASGHLSVLDRTRSLTKDIRTPDGRADINAFFAEFLPDDQKGRLPRLVTAPGHCFTDVGVHSPELMHAVSMLNLASVRDVEQRIGKHLDPHRFRANVLIEGLEPWVENEWLDRDIMLGAAACKGARLTRRCPATEVNPDTATRDINVPQELMRAYGHVNLGLYLHVVTGSTVRIGDAVSAPP